MKMLLLTLVVVLGFAAFAQETHDVHPKIMPVEGRPIPEFFFQPTGLFIEPGDTVRFVADIPHHTATAYHAQHVKAHRVPGGIPPFSRPLIPINESWESPSSNPAAMTSGADRTSSTAWPCASWSAKQRVRRWSR